MTTSTIAERVQRGAALLDTRFPGWVDSVDLSTLNLASGCDCILGQKFGDFRAGARQTHLAVETSSVPMGERSRDQLQEYGFLVNYNFGVGLANWSLAEVARVDREYAELTDAWAKLITDRRAASQLAEVREPAYAVA